MLQLPITKHYTSNTSFIYPEAKELNLYVYTLFQKLIIRRRPIRDIDSSAFQGFVNLRYLYITFCQLTKAPPIRSLAKTLVIFNLNVNNITYINNEHFRGFDLLEQIRLTRNRMISLPEMHYLNSTLKTLAVDRNKLADITSLYSVPMEKLTILTLDHNFLTNISFVNAMWPAIVSITLGDNLLTTIQPLRHVVQPTTNIRQPMAL